MTADEQAIVARCAAAVCDMCACPSKWQPVRPEGGGYYHVKGNRFDEAGTWCDASGIWHEFEYDPGAAAPVTDARRGTLPLFAGAGD